MSLQNVFCFFLVFAVCSNSQRMNYALRSFTHLSSLADTNSLGSSFFPFCLNSGRWIMNLFPHLSSLARTQISQTWNIFQLEKYAFVKWYAPQNMRSGVEAVKGCITVSGAIAMRWVDCVLDYYADLFWYISIVGSLWDTLIWRSR